MYSQAARGVTVAACGRREDVAIVVMVRESCLFRRNRVEGSVFGVYLEAVFRFCRR